MRQQFRVYLEAIKCCFIIYFIFVYYYYIIYSKMFTYMQLTELSHSCTFINVINLRVVVKMSTLYYWKLLQFLHVLTSYKEVNSMQIHCKITLKRCQWLLKIVMKCYLVFLFEYFVRQVYLTFVLLFQLLFKHQRQIIHLSLFPDLLILFDINNNKTMYMRDLTPSLFVY